MEYGACGAPEVFAEIYERFADRLDQSLRRMVYNCELVKDVVQETFLTVHLKARQFDGRSSAFTWVFTIAKNALISLGRRSMNRREQPTPGSDDLAMFRDRQPDPASQFIISQEREEFFDAIASLNAKHRMVILLLDIEGEDYEVAAKHLGIPVGTVRSRRHRALNQLRLAMVGAHVSFTRSESQR